ncbi:hypothetical protein QBC36DRAFT_305438 [Triangularia setosa]|uniref:BTB domain-containing protein n=1 Tax=Triangularia setosa TaxID=2587417 RepID=A0AAN6W014_9PEZI|nr:hypothetical protein QBC36DRAFT_305438 [Podospora setosa]
MSFGFGSRPASSVTEAVCDTTRDEPSKYLIGSLKGLYSGGEAIVCTQSEFFSTACRVGFKETQEGKFDLPDDDPRLVHIMVHYLYHFEYDVQLHHECGHFGGLETDGDGTDVSEPIRDVLVTHAKVYALAEKYMIRGLKAVTLRQFKAAATVKPFVSLHIIDFLQATWGVYTSTIEDDRGLRDIVVETLYKHSQWLDREEVRDVVKGLGALTYDLVIYMRQHGSF